jgi:hypothetical protein
VFYSREFVGIHLALLAMVVGGVWLLEGRQFRYILLFSSLYFNHIGFDVQGLSIRFDYLVCAAFVVVHIGHVPAALRHREVVYAYGLLASFLASSLFFAPAPAYSVRKFAIIAIYVVTATTVLRPRVHGLPMEDLLRLFVRVGNVVLLISVAGYILFLQGIDIGFVKAQEAVWLRGPMLNPNLFGSTAAVIGLLNLRTVLSRGLSVEGLAAVTLATVSVFLSYTRSAWLLFVVFSILFILLSLLDARRIRPRHIVLVVAISIGVWSFASVVGALGFQQKVGDILELQSGTGLVRVFAFQAGVQDWLHSPMFGRGFQTYELLIGAESDPTIIQQMIMTLQILQYGGVVALAWFVALVVRMHRRALDARRGEMAQRTESLALTAILGFDLLILAYQASSGLVLPFFWFYAFVVSYLVDDRLRASAAQVETPEVGKVPGLR